MHELNDDPSDDAPVVYDESEGRGPLMRRYSIRIDEDNLEVTDQKPSGRYLLGLVGKTPETHLLTQIIVGADDELIGPDERVDLQQPGRERFTVVRKECECVEAKLDLEGTIKEWGEPTITTEQIAELGGWNLSEGVVLIDEDQNERQLQPGEVITLIDGLCFSRKVRFRRG